MMNVLQKPAIHLDRILAIDDVHRFSGHLTQVHISMSCSSHALTLNQQIVVIKTAMMMTLPLATDTGFPITLNWLHPAHTCLAILYMSYAASSVL